MSKLPGESVTPYSLEDSLVHTEITVHLEDASTPTSLMLQVILIPPLCRL